jgi:hypothetical protein
LNKFYFPENVWGNESQWVLVTPAREKTLQYRSFVLEISLSIQRFAGAAIRVWSYNARADLYRRKKVSSIASKHVKAFGYFC